MGTIRLILLGLIVIVLISGFAFFKLWQTEREKRRIGEQNIESLMLSHEKELDLVLKLTAKEIKKLKPELVKLIKDSLNIKPKQLKSVVTTIYHHIYDTAKAPLIELNDSIFTFKHSFDSCIKTSGRVDINNEVIYFDNTEINNKNTSVMYWERKHKILFIKWGKKWYSKTINNCTGKTTVEKIDIINNK